MAGLIVLHADADAAGQRLDQWIAARTGADLSRSRIQALIRGGSVSVDGAAILEPRHKLAAGASITLAPPMAVDPEPQGEDILLAVLYEDDALIVIDKPAGLVVHPGAGNWSGTLVNALIHHCGESLSGIGGVKRPGIVHRLDKDTSGVMVVAKTDHAHHGLAEAFADHGRSGTLERAYQALVWGAPERRTGTVDAALGRHADRLRRAVVPAGRADARHAITRYAVMERFGHTDADVARAALVECRLETGRTHQIRVHMAHIGHPVIGDHDYGQAFRTKANRLPEPARSLAVGFPRQALHAWLLAFAHPLTGKLMRFESAIPADMDNLLASLRKV